MSGRILLGVVCLTLAAGESRALPPIGERVREARVEQARAEVEARRERVAWAERMARMGYLSAAQAKAERTRLTQAEAALLQAEGAAGRDEVGALTGLARRYAIQVLVARKKLELAQARFDSFRERAAWSERMVKRGYVTAAQARADRARVTEAADALRKATEELDALSPRPDKK
jgi:predicted negative regulator of RcsB-dependent stress response